MTEGSSWCMERPRNSVCGLAVRTVRRVAHSIVGETKGGYPVQGDNNDEEDSDLVTPAFTVASLATIMHVCPAMSAMPVTTLAAGNLSQSAYMPCAAQRPVSRKVAGSSMSAAMRSRTKSRPSLC